MATTISPQRSIVAGILSSLGIGLAAAGIIWLWFGWLNAPLITTIMSLLALGAAFIVLFPIGMRYRIQPYWFGVGLTNGEPNGKVYGPGEHWTFWFDDMTDVNGTAKRIDPEIFNVLAGRLLVEVDVFALVHVVNPLLYLQVEDWEGTIEKDLMSEVRLFVGQWSNPKITKQKDLMSEYLQLPPRGCPGWQAAHDAVRARLAALANGDTGTEPILTPAAIAGLMERAGSFRARLETWGADLDEVKVEDIMLPKSIMDAEAEMEAYRNKLAMKVMAAENLKTIIDTIMEGRPDSYFPQALETANMMIELPIKKTILSLSSSDLRELGKSLGDGASKVAEAFIKKFSD